MGTPFASGVDIICECPHKWMGRVRRKARVVELLLSQLADIFNKAYLPLPLLANLKLVATSPSSYVGHSIEAVTWAGMGDIHLVFRDRGVGDDG